MPTGLLYCCPGRWRRAIHSMGNPSLVDCICVLDRDRNMSNLDVIGILKQLALVSSILQASISDEADSSMKTFSVS